MKRKKKEAVCYTIEREFLKKVADGEMIKRMIRSHRKKKRI